jgi:hypothetical protein
MHGDFKYFEESRKINSAYCLAHGYDYVVDTTPSQPHRKTNWEKLPAIIKRLPEYDYLLYMDADAVFYSHDLTIEDELIPLFGGEDIAMASDCRDELQRYNPNKPNSGVIFMRCNQLVEEFMKCWNATTDDHPDWCFSTPADEQGLWNVAMIKYPLVLRLVKDYYRFNGAWGQYIRHFIQISLDWSISSQRKLQTSEGRQPE